MRAKGEFKLVLGLGLAGLALLNLAGCSALQEFRDSLNPKAAVERQAKAEQSSGRLVAEYKLVVIAPKKLRDLLETHLDLARFRSAPEDQRLSPQELRRLSSAAPQQARALLETEGFFNAQIEVENSAPDANSEDYQRPTITVRVEPGPQAKVTALTLNFSGELLQPVATDAAASAPEERLLTQKTRQRERMLSDWGLQVGEPFTQGEWSGAKSAMLGRARAQGYPLARWASSAARVDTESNSVELNLELASGPLFRLGELRISGLKHLPASVVERLAGFEPGEPYTERAMLDFQERLLRTTLFDSASVDIRPETAVLEIAELEATAEAADANQAPMVPAPAPAASSASAASDASSAAAEPAPAQSPAPATSPTTDPAPAAAISPATASPVYVLLKEAPRQQVTLSLGFDTSTGPRVGADYVHRQPFGWNLRSRTQLKLGKQESSADVELSSYPLSDMQRNVAALFAERLSQDGTVNSNLRARLGRNRETPQQDRTYFLEVLRARDETPQLVTNAGAVSANIQWTRRRVDSTLRPTKGYTGQLLVGAGYADSTTADNGGFGRGQLRVYGYYPLPAGFYGAARTELGQIFASDSVGLPEKLRFRTGGDESVRGYGFEGLGPVDAYGNPTGGRVQWSGSLEIAHGLMESVPDLLGALFVDAGQAAASWSELKPVTSVGLGLHYRSPLGTLRLDYAYATEPKKWRLHFSVGIAL
ncbi:BamA/TamA family outer membrane protein [Paucibacter sp. B2R-40]|uniref:autotransporter assembly complex protein TamA n=1 Tax=Paucibacter sp. B2R-40 TaxID=2893554 RepID=UPI0021E46D29|nr:BamA/TamA family outer membrane protein [Paucibacter sp. B2R-40]MCV2355112.1 BamA/TamA family outer membrane protein [Paucibacter sp. B2R-40]